MPTSAPVAAPVATGTPAPASLPAGSVSAPTSGNPNPLIVTSNGSRSSYADNVNTLNTAVNNTVATPSNLLMNSPSQPGGKTISNPSSTPIPSAGSGTSTTIAPDGTTTVNSQGTGGSTPSTTPNATGTVTPSNSSTDTSSTNGGQLDPTLKAQFDENNTNLENDYTGAQKTLANVTATLNNDPAAAAAVSQIKAQYDQLYQGMLSKNALIIGRSNAAIGAFGGLGQMSQNFMSTIMTDASNRLLNIITNENNAILKSNSAFQSGDLKAFNDATTNLKDAQTAKTQGIVDLANATSKALTDFQAQQKIDAANRKQEIVDNISLSKSLAPSIAKIISENGITDQKTIEDLISGVAKAHGVTDPSILSSAVTTAQAANTKADTTNANINSEINARNSKNPKPGKGGGKDGAYTYTSDDISTYSNLMDKGGTVDGTTYAPRGADGYVDPGSYTAVYNDWIKNGGTSTGFIKAFPVKGNVNPDGYTELPKALQPVVKSTSSYTA